MIFLTTKKENFCAKGTWGPEWWLRVLVWGFVLGVVMEKPQAGNGALAKADHASHVLGVCATVRYEGHLMIEWIEYHAMIGVTNFYLYLSPQMGEQEANLTLSILAPYQAAHDQKDELRRHINLQVLQQPVHDRIQIDSMGDCMERFASENTWLLFNDIDEFVAFPQGWNLRIVLAEARLRGSNPGQTNKPHNIDAFCIGWQIMVPQAPWNDERTARPSGSMLTQLIHRTLPFYSELSQGKLAIFTNHNQNLVPDCRFDVMMGHFSHNCFARLGRSSVRNVVDFLGNPMDNVLCQVPHANPANQVVALYHFFFRTCHEWVTELVPKRTAFLKEVTPNFMPPSRTNPQECSIVSQLNSAEAPFLQRFLPELAIRVQSHPMWKTPIVFPLPAKGKPNQRKTPKNANNDQSQKR